MRYKVYDTARKCFVTDDPGIILKPDGKLAINECGNEIEIPYCIVLFYPTDSEDYYIDEIGGVHDSGCGCAPDGSNCGECSNISCRICDVWNKNEKSIEKKVKRYTVVFDFDGVIHSYKSGWKGITEIPDSPVSGIKEAIDKIREEFNVVVVSTRCISPEGIKAIKSWLNKYNIVVDDITAEKPPAVCYMDDRAIRFDGNAAALPDLVKFKAWWE